MGEQLEGCIVSVRTHEFFSNICAMVLLEGCARRAGKRRMNTQSDPPPWFLKSLSRGYLDPPRPPHEPEDLGGVYLHNLSIFIRQKSPYIVRLTLTPA